MSSQEFCLKEFISYCEATDDNEWCIKIVRSKDNKKNCVFGHLFNFGSNKGGEKLANVYWDLFEECIATTFMMYAVNDGNNLKYQQDTAKKRCIAYLKNLESGTEKNVQQLTEDEYVRWKKRESIE